MNNDLYIVTSSDYDPPHLKGDLTCDNCKKVVGHIWMQYEPDGNWGFICSTCENKKEEE